MKKNIYYRAMYGRNTINQKVIPVFMFFLQLPKMILEVLLRKDMGERFFSPFISVLLAIALYFFPNMLRMGGSGWERSIIFTLFLIAYVVMIVVRYLEVRRAPSVFDFERFSLDPGQPFPFFYKIKLFGKTPSTRTVECYFEPLFCFIIGFLLLLIHEYLTGAIIIVCAICYFIGAMASAIRGDHFVMDTIDEIICNQDMAETYVQDEERSPRGVPFFPKKPSTAALRQEFIDHIQDDDEDDAVAAS